MDCKVKGTSTFKYAARLTFLTEFRDIFEEGERCLHHQLRSDLDNIGLINLDHLPISYVNKYLQPGYDDFISSLPPTCGYLALSFNPSRFERMLRISVPEFYLLYQELEEFIMQPRSIYHECDGDSKSDRKRTTKLHPVDQFCVWLFRADDTDVDLLGVLFRDVHRTTIDRVMDHVSSAIIACWNDEVDWPDAEERRMLWGRFSLYNRIVACLDGTHCQIEVPVDPEDEYDYYSGYKKYHTQNYLIAANGLSQIIFIDGPFPGRGNDRGAFNETVFMKKNNEMLSDGEVILTDGGFIGPGPHLFPFTSPQIDAADSEGEKKNMREYNDVLTLNRSMIEHCIHKIKNRAQALASRFSRSNHIQADLIQSAARLYNRTQRMRMIYSHDCKSGKQHNPLEM